MTKRCLICKQPITNTPYHHNWGNVDRCAKHCNCEQCSPIEQDRANDDGMASTLGLPDTVAPILVGEIMSEVFSSPDPSPSLDLTPDPTPDFGGFGGGESGGGGAGGDF